MYFLRSTCTWRQNELTSCTNFEKVRRTCMVFESTKPNLMSTSVLRGRRAISVRVDIFLCTSTQNCVTSTCFFFVGRMSKSRPSWTEFWRQVHVERRKYKTCIRYLVCHMMCAWCVRSLAIASERGGVPAGDRSGCFACLSWAFRVPKSYAVVGSTLRIEWLLVALEPNTFGSTSTFFSFLSPFLTYVAAFCCASFRIKSDCEFIFIKNYSR